MDQSEPGNIDPDLRFLVAYHDAATLDAAVVPPGTTKIHLDKLDIPSPWRDNKFAESRALLHLALNPVALVPSTGYLGLFHASYDTKFDLLPRLIDLPTHLVEHLSPSVVLCPITCGPFVEQADNCHPGMGSELIRILRRTNTPYDRTTPGPMTNTFVAHVDVWRRFLPGWLRLFIAAYDELAICNFIPEKCKTDVLPAYLAERLTTAWFASQRDLNCATLVTPDGSYYRTMDSEPDDNKMVHINYAAR